MGMHGWQGVSALDMSIRGLEGCDVFKMDSLLPEPSLLGVPVMNLRDVMGGQVRSMSSLK